MRLIFVLLLFVSAVMHAQTTLTFQNNSLKSRDVNTFQEIQFVDPGVPGANQTWDYSHAQFTGLNQCSSLRDAALPKMAGAGNYNLLLDETDYEYLLNSKTNELEELGYENSVQKMTLLYSDPVVKMKYPFSYGNSFTDHFAGIALYDGMNKIDVSGDMTVTADAYGTLILPDLTVTGALRVKFVKTGQQINMCGISEFKIVKYSWYATGYRYPLLNLNSVEYRTNGGAPVVTKTASLNTLQPYEKNGTIGSDVPASTVLPVKSAVKVAISPNPFVDQLIYSYVLPESMNISIDLYDMAGKTYGRLVSNQPQAGGFHNGELISSKYGLTPGVYFMRFSFNDQVAIYRVVKF